MTNRQMVWAFVLASTFACGSHTVWRLNKKRQFILKRNGQVFFPSSYFLIHLKTLLHKFTSVTSAILSKIKPEKDTKMQQHSRTNKIYSTEVLSETIFPPKICKTTTRTTLINKRKVKKWTKKSLSNKMWNCYSSNSFCEKKFVSSKTWGEVFTLRILISSSNKTDILFYAFRVE